jgi:hypothetical protein
MNREQRHRGISKEYIAQKILERDKQTQLITTKKVMYLFASELQSKYGWGYKRINKLMAGVVNTADCINGDYVKYEEIEKAMKEMGVLV